MLPGIYLVLLRDIFNYSKLAAHLFLEFEIKPIFIYFLSANVSTFAHTHQVVALARIKQTQVLK